MHLDAGILSSIITGAVAIAALLIQYRAYKRENSIQNENHFFLYKMEKYQEIITGTFDLINEFKEKIRQADLYVGKVPPDGEPWSKLEDEVDKRIEEHRRVLFKYSVFMPEHIALKLDEFYDSLFDDPQTEFKLKTMEEVIEPYENALMEIVELMRNDLGVEKLNMKLNRRMGSK